MKNISFSFVLLFGLAFLFNACKKKEEDPVRLQSVVPQSAIDNLVSKGMTINEGNKPPQLNLAVRVSPFELQEPYPGDGWPKGYVIADYFYNFYGQTDNQEITYDFYNDGKSDEGNGTGAFIMGSGNQFTVFSEETGTSSDIQYKRVSIISGTLDGNTIKNFQLAFVMTEKSDDPDGSLMPVNEARVWKDSDLVSESISNFRIAAEAGLKTKGSAVSAK